MKIQLRDTLSGRHIYLLKEGWIGARVILTLLDNEYADKPVDADTEIDFSHALALWLYDELLARRVLSRVRVLTLLQRLRLEIISIGKDYADELEYDSREECIAKWDPMMLAIADRRYVMLENVRGMLDLKDGRMIEEIPPTFEGITYNLNHLVAREWARIQGARTHGNPSEDEDGADES